MGRPYKSELRAIPQTVEWAANADIVALTRIVGAIASRPLLVVGSGGSVTACYLLAKLHSEHARQPVRVLTPYEFSLQPSDDMSSVVLLSAGGANRDILGAAQKATTESYENVSAIVAKESSPLSRMLSELPHALSAGFDIPFGKDGFLAVNSLLATSILTTRAYAAVFETEWICPTLSDKFTGHIDAALRPSIVVLAAGWSWPAALDLESKFNEAGFGTVVCTDHRNFAHGRHHGLARRAATSGVIALSTPECRSIADRTLRLIPKSIPRLHLVTEAAGASGAIDLIGQVFQLVDRVADCDGVDPGKPTVAEFGRRLYSLPLPRHGADRPLIDVWIQRKVSASVWCAATTRQRDTWRDAYKSWAAHIRASRFFGIALDYDGTLCEAYERAGNPRVSVVDALTRVLREGLRLGIATGRGDSVLDALRASIPKKHHAEIVVGLYNGAVVASLKDIGQRLADSERNAPVELSKVHAALKESPLIDAIANMRHRYAQLTITEKRPLPSGLLYRHIVEELSRNHDALEVCTVHESGHSVDIIPKCVSKITVVQALSADRNLKVLTIGDQGQLRGNDFAFLSRPESLSVERVSTAFDRCWNLAAAGSRGTAALRRYLDALRPDRSNGHRLDLDLLEES